MENSKKTSEFDLKLWEKQTDAKLEEWKYQQEWRLESFRAVIGFASLAIKLSLSVSTGALVILIAFIGNIWTESSTDARQIASELKPVWLWFTVSVVSTLLVAYMAYIAQHFFTHGDDDATQFHIKHGGAVGLFFQICGVLIQFVALVCIAIGCYQTISILDGVVAH